MFVLSALLMAAVLPAADAATPRVVCDRAGVWKLESESVSCGEGVSEFRVKMNAPEPAVPPKFSVRFSVPQDGEHHVWTADISSHAGLRVSWQGLYKSNLARSIPLACA